MYSPPVYLLGAGWLAGCSVGSWSPGDPESNGWGTVGPLSILRFPSGLDTLHLRGWSAAPVRAAATGVHRRVWPVARPRFLAQSGGRLADIAPSRSRLVDDPVSCGRALSRLSSGVGEYFSTFSTVL